jgi:hypothetical protein
MKYHEATSPSQVSETITEIVRDEINNEKHHRYTETAIACPSIYSLNYDYSIDIFDSRLTSRILITFSNKFETKVKEPSQLLCAKNHVTPQKITK